MFGGGEVRDREKQEARTKKKNTPMMVKLVHKAATRKMIERKHHKIRYIPIAKW